MNNKKHWLAIWGVAIGLVLAASVGTIAVMADNSSATTSTTTATTTTTTTTATTTPEQAMIDKIVAAYQQSTGVKLDATALQNAIQQAQQETRTADLQARLQQMVTDGKLTQAEADQISAWYQTMPSVLSSEGGLGLLGGRGMERGPGLLK